MDHNRDGFVDTEELTSKLILKKRKNLIFDTKFGLMYPFFNLNRTTRRRNLILPTRTRII